MNTQVRVFQTTLMKTPEGPEMVMVSCRSLNGVFQLSMQVSPDSSPLVGDIFDVHIAHVPSLGERIGPA